jgi:general secretion pathway protein L
MSHSQLHLHQFLAAGKSEGQAGVYRLWVPGEAVVCHQLKLPAAARRRWTETLPWMLEDQLIDEPANLHFSLGRADANDQVTALSVPREQMDRWMSLCESGPGKVSAVLPDYLALPWEEGGLSLLVEGERWIVRCGATEGYAGNETFVAALLGSQVASQPDAPISYLGPKERMPGFVEGRGRHLADALDWSFCDYPQELNLLRGEYRQAGSFKSLVGWLPAAAAILLFALLASGYGAANYFRIKAEVPLLQADLSTTYRALLGGTPPRSDIRSITEGAIAFRENQYLATQTAPLSLLVELDTFLSGCSSCQVRSIVANEQSVELVMSASDPVLERLTEVTDFNVKIDSIDETLVRATATFGGSGDG